jgi:acetyl esterase/lipase
MHSRWSLEPEIESGLGSLPPMPFEAAKIDKGEILAIRQAVRRRAGLPSHMRHDVLVVNRGPDVPPLDLHVYTARVPADQARPGLLWIHGGGYIIGSAADEAAA